MIGLTVVSDNFGSLSTLSWFGSNVFIDDVL